MGYYVKPQSGRKSGVLTRCYGVSEESLWRCEAKGWNWRESNTDEVLKLEKDVSRTLQDGEKEKQNKCLRGYCQKNCRSSYNLRNIVSKNLDEIEKLRTRGQFNAVVQCCYDWPRDVFGWVGKRREWVNRRGYGLHRLIIFSHALPLAKCEMHWCGFINVKKE